MTDYSDLPRALLAKMRSYHKHISEFMDTTQRNVDLLTEIGQVHQDCLRAVEVRLDALQEMLRTLERRVALLEGSSHPGASQGPSGGCQVVNN